MRELNFIAKQVEVTALSVGERLARIHDALYSLRDLTLTLHETAPHDLAAVDEWFRAGGFAIDAHGYYERGDVLARARAGLVDRETFTLYAKERHVQDAPARQKMHRMRGLGRHLASIAERMPRLAWLYYQDATGFALTYPMHDPCTVVPADFDWHEYITYQSVQPGVNPSRDIQWTPPNIDYGGKGLMVSASTPVYSGDELIGVWSFDVPVLSLIESSVVDSVVEGQESFIVDRHGVLIAHNTLETIAAPTGGEVYQLSISALGAGYANLDLRALTDTGRGELVDAQGTARYVVARALPIHDWLLVATFPQQGVFNQFAASFLEALARAKDGDLGHRVTALGDDTDPIVQSYNEVAAALETSIAEREDTLRALEASRNHARTLFASSPIGLALVDETGSMLDMNAELGRQLGLNEAVSPTGSRPLITFNIIEAASPATRTDVFDLISRAIESGESGSVEVELRRSSGKLVPVRMVARRLERDGASFALTGVEDITERRRLEGRVLHKHKMEAIGTLAGGVAHDFNNLLTSIMGNASLLARGLRDMPDKLKRVESIVLASERAAGLTSQLLSFSRRQMVQPRRLDLSSVVHQSERLLERLLPDSVTLQVHTEPTRHVKADEGQLSQVVMNLVLNARDALGRKGVITISLASSGEGPDALAVIEVSDDGVGMDEETRNRVFDPFFTTKSGGTGLGLSTVHDIVTGLGGTIAVQSAPGEGTRFRIELPTCDAPTTAAAPSAEPWVSDLSGTILVVDDEESVRDVTALCLSEAGLHVHTAANGIDGLAVLEELQRTGNTVSLVVTDVVMPGMGGRELAERIAQRYPEVPILFMCGYTDDTILRHGIAADSLQLLRKPFTSDSLVNAVRDALDAAER